MEEITITAPTCDTNDKIVLTSNAILPANATGANADYNKTIRIPKKKNVIRKKKEVKEKVKEEVKEEDPTIPGETDIRVWEWGRDSLYLKPCHIECDENGNYCDCPGPVYDFTTKKKLGSYLGSPNGFSADFYDPRDGPFDDSQPVTHYVTGWRK